MTIYGEYISPKKRFYEYTGTCIFNEMWNNTATNYPGYLDWWEGILANCCNISGCKYWVNEQNTIGWQHFIKNIRKMDMIVFNNFPQNL